MRFAGPKNEKPDRPILEHVVKKLSGLFDSGTLQLFDIERILVSHVIPLIEKRFSILVKPQGEKQDGSLRQAQLDDAARP